MFSMFDPLYKGAFGAYEPSLNNNRAAVSNNRTAIENWLDELAKKEKFTNRARASEFGLEAWNSWPHHHHHYGQFVEQRLT
jgi:hypothetical protein